MTTTVVVPSWQAISLKVTDMDRSSGRVIVMISDAVQPLAPVTVTVYSPGWLKVLSAVATLLDQMYCTPPSAVTDIVGLLQSSEVAPVLLAIVAVGVPVFSVTCTDALAEHWLASVAVTV